MLVLLLVLIASCSAQSSKKINAIVEWHTKVDDFEGGHAISGVVHLDLVQSLGKKFILVLEKNTHLFGADYRERVWENGVPKETPRKTWANHPSRHCHYTGSVEGDPNSHVRLSTCQGFHGLITAHGHHLLLQPEEGSHFVMSVRDMLQNYFPDGINGKLKKLRERQETEKTKQATKQKQNKIEFDTIEKRRRKLLVGNQIKYIETLAISDKARFDSFSNLEELGTTTASIFNLVTSYYRQNPEGSASTPKEFPYTMQVTLVGLETFTDADPYGAPESAGANEVKSDSLLNKMLAWGVQQLESRNILSHDNRVLLSGYDFDGQTTGLAYVSGMCDKSMSGNVNECSKSFTNANCAATVAHEMGHNLGMEHDSNASAGCPSSGYIMEAVGSDGATLFSSCSVDDLTVFFNDEYSVNGECLENTPTTVWGDPVCGNGFTETGEDCDCGEDDCGEDSCCDGSTCKFQDASYECDNDEACCSGCVFITKESRTPCRSAANECDITEYCPGTSGSCPWDDYDYPGITCTTTSGEKSYQGTCYAGKCHTAQKFCEVDVNRDYSDTAVGLTEECAVFNDECTYLFCTDESAGTEDYDCITNFKIDDTILRVPDGTSCWYKSDPFGTRRGSCYSGACSLPHTLASFPVCGNGGADFNEECDCGLVYDDSCDCQNCVLKAGKVCSGNAVCCEDDGSAFKPSTLVCRTAVNDCDEPEYCTGSSDRCPSDVGKSWESICTRPNGDSSTCYGKVCVDSLNEQCQDKLDNPEATGKLNTDFGSDDIYSDCTALVCCQITEYPDGFYDVCQTYTQSSTLTVDGVDKVSYFGGADSGTKLSQNLKRCIMQVETTLFDSDHDCEDSEYLDMSIGECLSCDPSCSDDGCTGPSNFDCESCEFGSDSRGSCAISQEQNDYTPVPASNPQPTSADDLPTQTTTTTTTTTTSTTTTENPEGGAGDYVYNEYSKGTQCANLGEELKPVNDLSQTNIANCFDICKENLSCNYFSIWSGSCVFCSSSPSALWANAVTYEVKLKTSDTPNTESTSIDDLDDSSGSIFVFLTFVLCFVHV